jgi:hypothetical protein
VRYTDYYGQTPRPIAQTAPFEVPVDRGLVSGKFCAIDKNKGIVNGKHSYPVRWQKT